MKFGDKKMNKKIIALVIIGIFLVSGFMITSASEDELIGILYVGDKLSQEMFTDADIQLLSTLAIGITLQIENITLLENEKEYSRKIIDSQIHSQYLDVLLRTNIELKNANKKLKNTQGQLVWASRFACLGELISGVIHQIDNPLTGILGNIQLLRLKSKKNPRSRLKEFIRLLNTIEDSALRCQKITENLLQFSHSGMFKWVILNINQAIENVLNLIKGRLEFENITLNKQLQSDLPAISGDLSQIQQVLLNLISNSQWAMKNTKVKELTIKTEFDNVAKKIKISVKDTGIGIPQEDTIKIFEPFYTTRLEEKKAGLGLSINKSIIREFGGDIKVQSRLACGSTFIIELPVRPR